MLWPGHLQVRRQIVGPDFKPVSVVADKEEMISLMLIKQWRPETQPDCSIHRITVVQRERYILDPIRHVGVSVVMFSTQRTGIYK